MELLHKKNGSTASLKEFRRKVKMIVESDVLQDYRLRYQPEADQVLFYTKDRKRLAESFGPSPTISVHRTPNFGLSNTDYRSVGHQSIGPSDTDASVHQTPGPKIRLVFPRLSRLILTPSHARAILTIYLTS